LIAVISDLHSNIEALQAVIDDIRFRGIERIVVLGDVIGYGPDPKPCVEMVKDLKPEVILMGNHEHALIHGCPSNMHPRARTTIEWTKEQLGDTIIQEMSTWPTCAKIDRIMAVHASPRQHVMEYIFPHDIKRPGLMKERFDKMEAKHCVVGHVHIPGVFTEDNQFLTPSDLMGSLYLFGNEKSIVNVGSVGQPRDLDNRACYITIDDDSVIFRRVPYDFRKTQEKILSRPNFDPFLAQRLEIGR